MPFQHIKCRFVAESPVDYLVLDGYVSDCELTRWCDLCVVGRDDGIEEVMDIDGIILVRTLDRIVKERQGAFTVHLLVLEIVRLDFHRPAKPKKIFVLVYFYG